VPSGPWGDTRHIERFGGNAEGNFLPPRRVESDGAVFVPIGLGIEALVVENPELHG